MLCTEIRCLAKQFLSAVRHMVETPGLLGMPGSQSASPMGWPAPAANLGNPNPANAPATSLANMRN